MKVCLNCEKEFQEQRETAKFCSTNCRVKYHQKNNGKKTEKVTNLKLTVLYNSLLEVIEKIGKNSYAFSNPNQHANPLPKVPSIKRSFEYYQTARIECVDIQQWNELKEQIMNDPFLTSKQKTALTS